jgi:hypothetical protein
MPKTPPPPPPPQPDPMELADQLQAVQNYLAQNRVVFEQNPTGENLGALALALCTMVEELLAGTIEKLSKESS